MKTSLLLLLTIFAALLSNAQIISTVAGDGTGHGTNTGAYGGDNGPATAAKLWRPTGMTIDKWGNMYIADNINHRIRKVDTLGTIISIFFTPTSINDVIVDDTGNVYFSDNSADKIFKISPSGLSTVAGTGVGGYSGDGGPASAAQLDYPSSLALDGWGNLYFADLQNQRIRKINPSGTITTIAGNGTSGYSGDGGMATAASMDGPTGVAIDTLGNLYFSDSHNDCVRKISTGGVITTIAGTGVTGFSGDGGPATLAKLNYPFGVVVDKTGNVYVGDRSNGRVRKITPAGIISTFAGLGLPYGWGGDGGPATAAGLALPTDLCIDKAGNMYILEFYNHDVRKVSICQTPSVPAIAGPPSVCTGASVVLSDSLAGGVWQVSPAGIATISASGTLTATSAGIAAVSYRISGICGTATASFPIVVNTIPYPGIISSPATLCLGGTQTLSATVPGGVWSHNDSFTAIAGSVITGLAAGSSTVTYSVSGACGASATTSTIDINPPMTPDINVYTVDDTLAYYSQIIHFFINTTYGGYTPAYQWYMNGSAVPGATSAIFSVETYWQETVYCVMTSSLDCITKTIDTSNTITISTGTLGMGNITAPGSYTLFPNPNNGTFILHTNAVVPVTGDTRFEVYDVVGRIVCTGHVNPYADTQVSIPGGNQEGQYFIRMYNKDESKVLQFVIRR